MERPPRAETAESDVGGSMGPHDDGDGDGNGNQESGTRERGNRSLGPGNREQKPGNREQGTEARGQGIGIERLGAAGPGARRPLQRGRERWEMGKMAGRKKIVEKNGKEWKKMENFFLSLWLA